MNSVLAIDIGTTSTKGLLVTSDGQVVASHQIAYPTYYPQPHFAEQDPNEILHAVIEVIRAIAAQHTIEVVSFSAAMHGIMAVDENGTPLTPLIIWADTRSIAQCQALEGDGLRQTLYVQTGTPLHPMSPLCKLLWWKEHRPDLLEQTNKFLSIKEYIFHCLAGQYIIDYSTASATGLFDVEKREWSSLAISLHQQPIEKFSIPVPPDFSIQLSDAQSSFLSLPHSVRWMVGASDGCCAQLGSGATQPGDISITVGTSGAVRRLSKSRWIDPHGRVFYYLLDADTFVCGGATNNATSVIKWFSSQFLQNPELSLPDFFERIKNQEAGSSGLIFLPYLFGERAPVYDAAASGVFFGISVQHTLVHFQRAVAEGICFALKSILETLEKGTDSSRLIVSGGITYSQVWLHMLSDVLGRELIIATDYDASAIGAAMIAFQANGQILPRTMETQYTISPDQTRVKQYQLSYAVYKTLYESLKNSFHTHRQLLH